MQPDASFTGRVVVITGASLGIGAELARQLAPERPRLVLAARDVGKLDAVAAECRALGAEVVVVPTDVGLEEDCRALAERAVAAFGGIDCLVLNAGIGMWARVDAVRDLTVYERIMRVNYLGSVWCASYALPALRRARGRLVVVSSLTGKTGVPTRSGYAASKHALHGFFDSLRIELRGTGVSVTMVCPGFVATGIRERNLDASGRPAGHSHVDEQAAMPVEACVAIMLRAMRGRKREVVYTARARFGQWLKLLAPGMVDAMAARVIARGR
jgi:NAD(P)-dependent dehydrogenase (short-subunit alcohol dehydrogenase family)